MEAELKRQAYLARAFHCMLHILGAVTALEGGGMVTVEGPGGHGPYTFSLTSPSRSESFTVPDEVDMGALVFEDIPPRRHWIT